VSALLTPFKSGARGVAESGDEAGGMTVLAGASEESMTVSCVSGRVSSDDSGCDEDCEEADAGRGAKAPMGVVGCEESVCGFSSDEGDDEETGCATPTAAFAGAPGALVGSASERVERLPGRRKAQDASVKKDVLRFRRDALALRNRFVQSGEETVSTSGRREFGAGVGTIASPRGFGAPLAFSHREKTAPETKKATFLRSRR
jgi:hypothetical protein